MAVEVKSFQTSPLCSFAKISYPQGSRHDYHPLLKVRDNDYSANSSFGTKTLALLNPLSLSSSSVKASSVSCLFILTLLVSTLTGRQARSRKRLSCCCSIAETLDFTSSSLRSRCPGGQSGSGMLAILFSSASRHSVCRALRYLGTAPAL